MASAAMKNGELIDDAALTERGFTFADGCFETLRCVGHVVPLWPQHKARALAACHALDIALSSDELDQQLEHVLAVCPADSVIKLILTRRDGGRASYPAPSRANVYAHWRPLPSAPRAGVALVSARRPLAEIPSFAGMKLIARTHYTFACAGQAFSDTEEALFQLESGALVETMHHNLFLLLDGQWVTPVLTRMGVAGVMRQYLLSQSLPPEIGVCTEGTLTLADFDRCHGAFISNAVEGVVPVLEVNQRRVPMADAFASMAQHTREVLLQ